MKVLLPFLKEGGQVKRITSLKVIAQKQASLVNKDFATAKPRPLVEAHTMANLLSNFRFIL